MNEIGKVLEALIPVVAALNGLGLVVKYVPLKFLGGIKNELIPFLNVAVAFLAAFSGGVTNAHAGIFGDIAGGLSGAAKAGLSVFATGFAYWNYEMFLRPIMNKVGLKNNEALVGKA